MSEWKDIPRKDVDKAFDEKIEYLKKKKTIWEKLPLGGYSESDAGDFVTLIDSAYPIKMFVLQEMSKDQYIRIGYYVVSLKKWKEKGEIQLVWGQFNPSYLKKDFLLLLEKARKEKIL